MAFSVPLAGQPMNRRVSVPAQFLNRELGILAFNRRVLAQAADESVPLLERLRFITIVSSNLDEFFEIRVAGLKEQIKLGLPEPDGVPPVPRPGTSSPSSTRSASCGSASGTGGTTPPGLLSNRPGSHEASNPNRE
jgi:hypothetical protein